MSQESGLESDLPQQPTENLVVGTRRPGNRKSLQSGFSLLARGEPKIWFTGGMLVICLAMIIGLLGLILVSGLPSFWADPIDLLALNDGSLEIGQIQRVRNEPDAQALIAPAESLPGTGAEAEASSGPADLADERERGRGITQRRYYRTGNFRLTGRHYRWISSQELGPLGIGRPNWATVVERLTWGRLYGIPLTVEKRLLPAEKAREKLQAIGALREILDSLSSEQSSQMQESWESLASELLDSGLREQIRATEDLNEVDLRVQTTDADDWIVYADVTETSRLTAVLLKWANYPSAFDALQSNLEIVSRQRDELERVKYEISRLDAQLSELRVNVRRAELAAGEPSAVQVDTSHYLLEQQEILASRSADIADLRKRLTDLLPNRGRLIETVAATLDDYLQNTLPEESDNLVGELAAWMEPTTTQPQPIRNAISEYHAGYRAIVRQKQPLEKRLLDLEEQLDQTQITFAVPTDSRPISDVSDDDLDALLAGNVTDGLRNALDAQSIELADESPQIETLSDMFSLISLKDRSGDKKLFAVSTVGYLSTSTSTDSAAASASDASTPLRHLQLLGEEPVGCREIVRAVDVNRLDLAGKIAVYVDRWREFLFDNPREANTEGGVFPAIWGTIVMTMIMTIVVVPFGVMAALYLREYTRSGLLVSIIRISINNLAGVPSIVYGVFGFSFFCYTIGAYIDGGAKNADISPWPSATWFSMLGLVAVVGTAAFFFSFFSGLPSHKQTLGTKWMSRAALCGWLLSLGLFSMLMLKSPFFSGFYEEYLPNPTYGKGGLLWAALTLALLTLPVVIVATEEALAAVPNSLREGSLACGASKWQTIWRIVLPHARPGILTGAILAMARGAGEVAPLMLVGALPSAPDLPVDTEFPFFHLSRSFMHLGYQIFTLGFNSQNSEAAKPMVFTCTLLLILIVATLNLFAIFLRARLKRRFHGTQF